MTQPDPTPLYQSLSGGQTVLDWFGTVPDFHDAEILDLHLNRRGPSTLRLHTWTMTTKTRSTASP